MQAITYITLALGLIMTLNTKLVVVNLDNWEDMRELSKLIGKGGCTLVFGMGQ